jgi:hypothetical protein
MRDRLALRALERLGAAQEALQSQAQASLAAALDEEEAKRAALIEAEQRLERALEDWRHRLDARLDPALLEVFAAALPLRENDRVRARETCARAELTSHMRRLDYAQTRAQSLLQATLARRLRRKFARKTEERALAALEHLPALAGPKV